MSFAVEGKGKANLTSEPVYCQLKRLDPSQNRRGLYVASVVGSSFFFLLIRHQVPVHSVVSNWSWTNNIE